MKIKKILSTAFIVSVICILLLNSALVVGASSSPTIPKEVSDYAETVLDYLSGVSSGSGVKAGGVALGDGYPLLNYSSELVIGSNGSERSGSWVFFANDEKGVPVTAFRILTNGSLDQKYGFMGPVDAKGLYDAIVMLKTLQEKEGVDADVTIFNLGFSGFIVIGGFNGEERVITVNNHEKLDDSYYAVQSSSELPSRKELDDAFESEEQKAEELKKEKGLDDQYILTGGVPSLAAHPVQNTASSQGIGSVHSDRLAWIIAIAAGGLVIVSGIAAFLLSKQKRKASA